MPRGKLILICQSGGEFVTNDDGCLSYSGGEAHALDINSDALFDHLKLKLAEMCDLEYTSLSVKYFLPGNKRTLITLSNDRDLKRMYEFHANSVTADIFVMGTQGFNREASYMHAAGRRECGIKPAETVNSTLPSRIATTTPTVAPAARGHLVSSSNPARGVSAKAPTPTKAVNSETPSPTGVVLAITSKPFKSLTIPKNPTAATFAQTDAAVPTDAFISVPVTFDMNASPADTVKKRRRTASWKIGVNGPSIVSVDDDDDDDDDVEIRKSTLRKKKKTQVSDSDEIDVDVEPLQYHSGIEPWIDEDMDCNDLPPEKLIACWKKGISGVGQDFKSVVEFREALQKYAIAHQFVYRLKKNDTNRASGRCVVEDCSWRIHASWVPSEEVFRIKKMNDSHTCGGKSWKAAHPTKNWLVSVIKERLRDNPRQRPKEIANGIFKDFGVQLNYTQVWRGIEDAKVQLQGSHKEAYNQLPSFCDKIVEANPGSFAKLLLGDDNKFHRLFICFDASIYGFLNGCRPLLFLDSTPLKSKYHEILFTVTALDGDGDPFPVSFAIVDVENEENWHWFLEQLRSAISTSKPITFVSEKEKGLMKSVFEVFQTAHHGYSMYHLLENFMRNLKGPFHGDGKGSLPGSLLAAAHAVRPDGFRMHMEKIKRVSVKAYDWLMQIEPEYWTNALFRGERYNQVTVDVAELYTNWIEEVRELPIIQKVEALRSNLMELIHVRQMESSRWTTKLVPSIEKKLREESLNALFLRVLFSSDTLFEVHDDSIHVVDTEKKECSCLGWDVNGLPCRHAVAVFNCKSISIYDFCSAYFTADLYRETYSKSINPVVTMPSGEETDTSMVGEVIPPTTPRPPAQPKEKRLRASGELKRVMSCSRCKGEGHNRATCKEPIEPSPCALSSDQQAEPASNSNESNREEHDNANREIIEPCTIILRSGEQSEPGSCSNERNGEGQDDAICKEPIEPSLSILSSGEQSEPGSCSNERNGEGQDNAICKEPIEPSLSILSSGEQSEPASCSNERNGEGQDNAICKEPIEPSLSILSSGEQSEPASCSNERNGEGQDNAICKESIEPSPSILSSGEQSELASCSNEKNGEGHDNATCMESTEPSPSILSSDKSSEPAPCSDKSEEEP